MQRRNLSFYCFIIFTSIDLFFIILALTLLFQICTSQTKPDVLIKSLI